MAPLIPPGTLRAVDSRSDPADECQWVSHHDGASHGDELGLGVGRVLRHGHGGGPSAFPAVYRGNARGSPCLLESQAAGVVVRGMHT